MFNTNTKIEMSISCSHNLIPFSSSFMPKINLEYYKKGSNFAVNLQVQNAKKEGFDPKATFSIVHNKTMKDAFGCEVQVLSHSKSHHFNLIVVSLLTKYRLDSTDKKEIAKQFARAAVYRRETVYRLISSLCTSEGKSKKVNGIACQEYNISLVYKKQEIEVKLVDGKKIENVLWETDVERKVVVCVDVGRKKEFKFIGSLVQLLQNEIPELARLKKVLKDISGHLAHIGWPMKLEFNFKKHVNVTVHIKSIQVLSEYECPNSLFLVPR